MDKNSPSKYDWVCGRGLQSVMFFDYDSGQRSRYWEYTTFKSRDGTMRRFCSFPQESIDEAYSMNEEFDLKLICLPVAGSVDLRSEKKGRL